MSWLALASSRCWRGCPRGSIFPANITRPLRWRGSIGILWISSGCSSIRCSISSIETYENGFAKTLFYYLGLAARAALRHVGSGSTQSASLQWRRRDDHCPREDDLDHPLLHARPLRQPLDLDFRRRRIHLAGHFHPPDA